MAAKKKSTKTTSKKKSTSKIKKTDSKPKSPKKKATSKSTKVKKTTAPKKKKIQKKIKLTTKELLLKQFERPKVKIIKVDNIVAFDKIQDSPSILDGFNKKETKRIRLLLFKKFDLTISDSKKSDIKSLEDKKPIKKLTKKELLLKKFEKPKIKLIKISSNPFKKIKEPPSILDSFDKKETKKIQLLLFKKFDLKISESKDSIKDIKEKKLISLPELLHKKFSSKKTIPIEKKSSINIFSNINPPSFSENDNKEEIEKLKILLFKKFNLKEISVSDKRVADDDIKNEEKQKVVVQTSKNEKIEKDKLEVQVEKGNKVEKEVKAALDIEKQQNKEIKSQVKANKKDEQESKNEVDIEKEQKDSLELQVESVNKVEKESKKDVDIKIDEKESPKLQVETVKKVEKESKKDVDIKKKHDKDEVNINNHKMKENAVVKNEEPIDKNSESFSQKEYIIKKEENVMPNNIKYLSGALIFIFVVLLIASFSNSKKYYLVKTDKGVKVFKGDFSPGGKTHVLTIDDMDISKDDEAKYSKQVIYSMIAAHYLKMADELITKEDDIPDFKLIREFLDKADYYADIDLKKEVEVRLNGIDFWVNIYKADMNIVKGERENIDLARQFITKASQLITLDYQKNMVEQRLAKIETLEQNFHEDEEIDSDPVQSEKTESVESEEEFEEESEITEKNIHDEPIQSQDNN